MAWMAKTDEPIVQLVTRIPKELHRRLKLHCVTHEIDVQDFVTQAIEEKLGRKSTVSRLGAGGMRGRRPLARRCRAAEASRSRGNDGSRWGGREPRCRS